MKIDGRCVLGRAGGSLDGGAAWAETDDFVRRKAAESERATADILNGFAKVDGATVLHDLRMPNRHSSANIDHAVVSGTKVWLLDTKWWKPGFYWTLRGHTRRKFDPAPAADKQTIAMGVTQIEAFLANAGLVASVAGLIVTWPSREGQRVTTWAIDIPGAGTVPHTGLPGWCKAKMRKRADEDIVAKMADLLIEPPRPTGFIAAGLEGF